MIEPGTLLIDVVQNETDDWDATDPNLVISIDVTISFVMPIGRWRRSPSRHTRA